jgi:hypothetical protein
MFLYLLDAAHADPSSLYGGSDTVRPVTPPEDVRDSGIPEETPPAINFIRCWIRASTAHNPMGIYGLLQGYLPHLTSYITNVAAHTF